MPERLAKRVWLTKSQSSLLNIYFRLSGHSFLNLSTDPCLPSPIFPEGRGAGVGLHTGYSFLYLSSSITVRIPVHSAPKWGLRQRTYSISDTPLSRSARRSFASLQRSRWNHCCYVWTEGVSLSVEFNAWGRTATEQATSVEVDLFSLNGFESYYKFRLEKNDLHVLCR